MSQIFKAGIGGTPSVPTSFTEDSGTAVPVANNLNISGGSTSDNNANGITTVGSGSTVTIELTNRLNGAQSAAGAVTIDLVTVPLAATPSVYRFEYKVAGRETTTGDGVGYTVFATVKTNGVAATLVESPTSPFFDSDEDAALTGADINFVASANNAILQVTGVAGTTITYEAVGTYVVV